QRLPESFFRNIITLTKYGNPGLVKQYSILPIIRSIWNSWDNFEKFLSGFDESNVNGLKEFKNFYSQCIEGDRIKYIEFDFKEIDLSNAILFLE
ncbi:MAG: hypothetical protein Q8859_07615, partial [Bacteroidota bacterium]|nr:hypothetical protein [Bacteroidota bacterium]